MYFYCLSVINVGVGVDVVAVRFDVEFDGTLLQKKNEFILIKPIEYYNYFLLCPCKSITNSMPIFYCSSHINLRM